MRFPEDVEIAPEKLRDYVLNPNHPRNRGKARLFAALGYTKENWAQLASDIRSQHLKHEAFEIAPNQHGTRWQIDALLHGPNGEAKIRTGWAIDYGSDRPRFITAYRVPQ